VPLWRYCDESLKGEVLRAFLMRERPSNEEVIIPKAYMASELIATPENRTYPSFTR
jgi:hypothetical protein